MTNGFLENTYFLIIYVLLFVEQQCLFVFKRSSNTDTKSLKLYRSDSPIADCTFNVTNIKALDGYWGH